MSIVDDLNWRYACKVFDPTKKISEEDFNTLKEALRLTPSSYGIQPWKFVLVEDASLREELVGASWNQKQVQDASHLIVMCAPLAIDENLINNYVNDIAQTRGLEISELDGFKKMILSVTKWDEAKKQAWAKNQIYIALGNLMTVCAQMQIDCCPMEGFQPAKYDEILNLKDHGLRSVVVAPVGYRSKDDKYIQLKKVRYSQDQLFLKI